MVGPDHERLRQPVGLVLYRVGQVDAEIGSVAEQPVKARGVLRRGDHQDVADAGHHQRGQRVVDHRFVVDRHQLLADAHGDRVQPGARSAGQDDPAHQPVRSASVSSVAASAAARSSCRNTDVTWSCTTRNAEAAVPSSPVTETILLFDDDHAVVDVDPAGLGLPSSRLRPLAQGGVPLGGAVGVTDLDVVAGQRQQGVEVACVERVVPGEDGGHLRSGHAGETTPPLRL